MDACYTYEAGRFQARGRKPQAGLGNTGYCWKGKLETGDHSSSSKRPVCEGRKRGGIWKVERKGSG